MSAAVINRFFYMALCSRPARLRDMYTCSTLRYLTSLHTYITSLARSLLIVFSV